MCVSSQSACVCECVVPRRAADNRHALVMLMRAGVERQREGKALLTYTTPYTV